MAQGYSQDIGSYSVNPPYSRTQLALNEALAGALGYLARGQQVQDQKQKTDSALLHAFAQGGLIQPMTDPGQTQVFKGVGTQPYALNPGGGGMSELDMAKINYYNARADKISDPFGNIADSIRDSDAFKDQMWAIGSDENGIDMDKLIALQDLPEKTEQNVRLRNAEFWDKMRTYQAKELERQQKMKNMFAPQQAQSGTASKSGAVSTAAAGDVGTPMPQLTSADKKKMKGQLKFGEILAWDRVNGEFIAVNASDLRSNPEFERVN